MVELDVRATADGQLVVFHDDTLDRITDARGLIAELPFNEVRQARIAGRERIPTLTEVLDACPDVMVNIDPKSDGAVGPLLDVLAETDAYHRVCIASFSQQRLETIRQATPDTLTTAAGPREIRRLATRSMTRRRAARTNGDVVQVPLRHRGISLVTTRFVAAAHAAGLEVHVWVIDDEAEMVQLLDMGVDGIVTDRPDVLRAVFRQRGIWDRSR